MYFTGDTSKAVPSLKGTQNSKILSGATSPCFVFEEILIDLLYPVIGVQKQDSSNLASFLKQ
jgi:hypothetical protein